MSTTEVMTAALNAAAFFSSSYEKSRKFLEYHYDLSVILAKPFHEVDSLEIYLTDSYLSLSARISG